MLINLPKETGFSHSIKGKLLLKQLLSLLVLLLVTGGIFEGVPQAQAASSHSIRLSFETPKSAAQKKVYQELGYCRAAVAIINKSFALPSDIYVRFVSEDNEYGVHYDPSNQTIVYPYASLLEDLRVLRLSEEKRKKGELSLTQTVGRAAVYTLLHELGHAFIDVLELSIPGNEEDLCDDFAGFMTAICFEDGADNDLACSILDSWAEVFVDDAMLQLGVEIDLSDPAVFSHFVSDEHSNSFRRGLKALMMSGCVSWLSLEEEERESFMEQLAEMPEEEGALITGEEMCKGIINAARSFAGWAEILAPKLSPALVEGFDSLDNSYPESLLKL